MHKGIFPALERIRVAGLDAGIVLLPVDQLGAFFGVFFGEQSFDRLLRRKIRIAVIKIPIRKSQVHGLIERVDILRAVEAHRFQIEILQHIQRLQHDRALHPAVELVNVNPLVIRHHGVFNVDFPIRQIFHRVQPALLARAADIFLRNVSFIKTIIRGVNRFLPVFAGGQGLLLGFNQLLQRAQQIGLAKNLSRLRRFAFFAEMRQKNFFGIRPLLEALFLAFDAVGGLRFNRIALRHLHGRLQHLLQAHGAKFRQHRHEATGRAGRYRGERAIFGRIIHLFLLEKFRSCAGRGHAKRIDANDFFRVRVVNERLRFAAPA